MRYHLKLFALFISAAYLTAACGTNTDDSSKHNYGPDIQTETDMHAKVIYGDDDRLDLYQVQDRRFLQAAESTAALVLNADLKTNGNRVEIATINFGSSYSPALCSDERFREQDTAAYCSGFLVAPNLIATAGHCIRTQGTQYSDCETTSFVFDFALKRPSERPKSVSADSVYRCKSIVKSVLTNTGADYAIVELDRPVTNRTPLKIRRQGTVNTGDPLVVMGYPSGLPLKVAGNASVRKIDRAHFIANLDTYGGNSGSAVFNANTMEVEGILVRGEEDFVKRGNCTTSKRCAANGCRGEDVTKISEALSFIPERSKQEEDDGKIPPQFSFRLTPDLNIPDNSPAGVTTSVIADRAPNGRPVYVEVHITHPWRGDLILTLTAPDGTTVTLANRQGRSADHIIGVYGEDLTAPGLDQLALVKRAGEWRLNVSDRASRDTGTLKSWGIRF